MALYVLQDGCPFEQAVMLKEQANPEFAFLFDLKSPEHIYYRWRLYSLANEDSLMRWHVEPFWLVEETARYALLWLLSPYTGFDGFQWVPVAAYIMPAPVHARKGGFEHACHFWCLNTLCGVACDLAEPHCVMASSSMSE